MNPTLRSVPIPIRRQAHTFLAKTRLVSAYGGFRRAPVAAVQYLISSRELDNFTYEISNTRQLADFIADALGAATIDTLGYVRELEDDRELEAALATLLAGRPDRNQRASSEESR